MLRRELTAKARPVKPAVGAAAFVLGVSVLLTAAHLWATRRWPDEDERLTNYAEALA